MKFIVISYIQLKHYQLFSLWTDFNETRRNASMLICFIMKLHHYWHYFLMLCGVCCFSTAMTTFIQLSFFILQPDNVENSSYISLQQRMCYEWVVYFLSSFGLFKQSLSCRGVLQGRSNLSMQIRKPCNSYFKSPALFTNLLTDWTYIRVRH